MTATILAWVNAALGFTLASFALFYIRKGHGVAGWIKALTVLVGLYWGGLYTWIAIVPPGIVDSVWFGQVFVRPAFTVTLAVMAGGAIYRWRSYD